MSYNGPVCKAKSVSVAQNGGKRESSVGGVGCSRGEGRHAWASEARFLPLNPGGNVLLALVFNIVEEETKNDSLQKG